MPEIPDKKKLMGKAAIGAGVAALAAGLLVFMNIQLQSNLKSTMRITQSLREEVEALRKENDTYKQQDDQEISQIQTLSAELNSLKEDKTLSIGRQEELQKLVAQAEKTLEAQNSKIANLELKLREAEERMARQKQTSSNLEKQTRSAKANPGMTQEYVKLVENEWMGAIAKTEDLKRDLDQTLMELSSHNKERSKLRSDTATMHYNLAVLMVQQGNHRNAILEYQKVLEIRPNDADAHYNLAILYDDILKNSEKALEHYRQFVQAAPEAPEAPKVKMWIKEKEFDTTQKFKL